MAFNRLSWFDHGDYATVVLPVTEDIAAKFAPRAKDGFTGNGLDLAALAKVQIESFRPELKPLIGFDANPGTFSAYSKHTDELLAFAEEFDKALDDPFAFAFLLDNAKPSAGVSDYGIDAMPEMGSVGGEGGSFGESDAFAAGGSPAAGDTFVQNGPLVQNGPERSVGFPYGILTGLRCPQCGRLAVTETTTLGPSPESRSLGTVLTIAVIIFIAVIWVIVGAAIALPMRAMGMLIVVPLIVGIVFAVFIVSFVRVLRQRGHTVRRCAACGFTEAVDPQGK